MAHTHTLTLSVFLEIFENEEEFLAHIEYTPATLGATGHDWMIGQEVETPEHYELTEIQRVTSGESIPAASIPEWMDYIIEKAKQTVHEMDGVNYYADLVDYEQ